MNKGMSPRHSFYYGGIMNEHLIKPIAKIYNSYTSKFAIPRQSGLDNGVVSKVIFEEEFRSSEAVRSIESFSHLWLIWGFSENPLGKWSHTVRPPKLGGNKRVGVFATRSPFRPNGLGLSSVKLEGVKKSPNDGVYLLVSGADILNGTPIYDIKPYLPYTDIHDDATGGFTDDLEIRQLEVIIPDNLALKLSTEELNSLENILKQDPRPSYHNDPDRVYGFTYGKNEVKFKVEHNILTVTEII